MADTINSADPSAPTQKEQRDRTMSLGNAAAPTPAVSATTVDSSTASSHGVTPPVSTAPSAAVSAVQPPVGPDVVKMMDEVLSSDNGVTIMINRLKESIASAKEFAFFLKKRSQLEEEHASGMKKLCRMSNDVMRRPEHRQGTWAHAYEDVMVMHERMCENSIQFAGSLHHMHEDLLEMAALAEKSRKGWKQNGLTAETRIQELEQQMKKSKARYDQLAEEYDRVRTGDSRSSGKGFFKSVKSAAQQEEELLRKLQTADQDYRSRVDMFRHERASVTSTTRPDAVKGLQDLIRECDAGLSLQLQKFASFNEKLVLSNGLIMSPIKSQTVKTSPYRSLREIASSVDNEKDLQDFLMMQHKLLPPRFPEPKYERNPILNPPNNHTMYPAQPQGQQPVQQAGTSIGGTPHMLQPVISTLGQQHQMGKPPAGSVTPASQGMGVRPGMGLGMGSGSAQSPTMSLAGSTMGASSMGSSPIGPGFRPPGASTVPGMQYQWVSSGSPQQFAQAQQHGRSFSQGSGLMVGQEKTQTGPQQLVRNSAGPPPRFNGTISSQAPQLGSLPFQIQEQGQLSPPQQTQGLVQGQIHQQLLSQQQRGSSPSQNTGLSQGSHASLQNPISNAPSDPSSLQVARSVSPPTAPMATPSRPVFGVALDKLYERDKVPVPMVVYRCIQAIDLFGLNMEGIYRLSGSQAHVQKLRILFDTAGVDGNSPDTDFRNPENFFHDVNSVAGLLKQFFRDLPDPLFTRRMYGDFIEAAQQDDDVIRRDSLHAIINSLPDPNYATLKALTLHLYRVMENSTSNRMSSQNLAIVFGPTLLGSSPDSNIADAGWHSRVIDTILQNTYQIFDED